MKLSKTRTFMFSFHFENNFLKFKYVTISQMRSCMFSFHFENNFLKFEYVTISQMRSCMFSKFKLFVADSLNNHFLLQSLLVQLDYVPQYIEHRSPLREFESGQRYFFFFMFFLEWVHTFSKTRKYFLENENMNDLISENSMFSNLRKMYSELLWT